MHNSCTCDVTAVPWKGRNHTENFDEKDQQALGDLKATAPLFCSDLLVATSLGKR